MRNVLVTTTLNQYLEVSDDTTLDDVLEFLANSQSFRDAFKDLGTDKIILEKIVVSEENAEFYID